MLSEFVKKVERNLGQRILGRTVREKPEEVQEYAARFFADEAFKSRRHRGAQRFYSKLGRYIFLCALAFVACSDDGDSKTDTGIVSDSSTTDTLAQKDIDDTDTTSTGDIGDATTQTDIVPTHDGTTSEDQIGDTGTDAGVPWTPEQAAIMGVEQTEAWELPGLQDVVQVVRTEGNVPHIYAKNRKDLAYVEGFVLARDRYFMMDLSRRLSLGTLSALLGDLALPTDVESRLSGTAFVAQRLADGLSDDMTEVLDAFASGINHYITEVAAGTLPLPSELKIAGPLLGFANPAELMKPFGRLDVAAAIATLVYETSYEGGDVGTTQTAALLGGLFEGAAFEELRREGAKIDIWDRLEPIHPLSSSPSIGTNVGTAPKLPLPPAQPKGGEVSGNGTKSMAVPMEMLTRLSTRLEKMQKRLLRDKNAGFGSNTWAVAGDASTDGFALMAGDGHLPLTVPSVLYQIALDTSVFGGGDTHQIGLTVPGYPLMAIGTNGNVAWSQTQLMGDITDWYREVLILETNGAPKATLFQGVEKPLIAVEETYEIAEVKALGSVGRTETWNRYLTFDGRFIADIEGDVFSDPKDAPEAAALVYFGDHWIMPKDSDGDGNIIAISFDYVPFDTVSTVDAVDGLGHAANIEEFRQWTRGLFGYSQNFAVADRNGNILYSSYQPVPCRTHLDRNPDGSWMVGSDPSMLLDGTQYGGFTIETAQGIADESNNGTDPQRCVIPFDQIPQSINPAEGFVFNANNDPGGLSLDGKLDNDAIYIGGPWDAGLRAETIHGALAKAVEQNEADLEKMAEIQGNVQSPVGRLLLPYLLAALDSAAQLALSRKVPTPAQQRIITIYLDNETRFLAAKSRLESWQQAGYHAQSGVKTFYSSPSVADMEAAVATQIFNAWSGPFVRRVFEDEKLPGVWRPGGADGQLRAVNTFLKGRGPDNPGGLASWYSETEESVFFDVLGTDQVEVSDELMLEALVEALDYLESPSTKPGEGGFGTTDMSQWLWGLRHFVKFESLLAEFLGDNAAFSFLSQQFSITTAVLPLLDDLEDGSPLAGLMWFPRNGDQDAVDAANSGLNGKTFSYGSGPVMRMVVGLKDGEVKGRNVIPGGQSGLTDSPYFADQAALWLGNQTLPLRFAAEDVAMGAIGREVYSPPTE